MKEFKRLDLEEQLEIYTSQKKQSNLSFDQHMMLAHKINKIKSKLNE